MFPKNNFEETTYLKSNSKLTEPHNEEFNFLGFNKNSPFLKLYINKMILFQNFESFIKLGARY